MSEFIRQILEHVLGQYTQEIKADAALGMTLIQKYVARPELISSQLKTVPLNTQLVVRENVVIPTIQNWQEFLQESERQLEAVKQRQKLVFEQNSLMPNLQTLWQMQDQCLKLSGNLSCAYLYFIEMCQNSHITSFRYLDIEKRVSPDGYVSQINLEQRRKYQEAYKTITRANYIQQGGLWPHGYSEIDETQISNVFYYKAAQRLLVHQQAKQLITEKLSLQDFGQVPLAERVRLWQLICEYLPYSAEQDQQNIFYKYAQFMNESPGEFFSGQLTPEMWHEIVKIAGIQSGMLILFPRAAVDNLVPIRYLYCRWLRKYALTEVCDTQTTLVRSANITEYARILPNRMPYMPSHGLSLCGNGNAHYSNEARDVEKMFRELKLFCPQISHKQLLPGEALLNVSQNTNSYSTIPQTQHTHFGRGCIDIYPLFNLDGELMENHVLNARIEIIQIGTVEDAIYLRLTFASLDDEEMIKFLIRYNQAVFEHFGGYNKVDAYMHLFPTVQGQFVFIYEPHVRLQRLENDQFLNPESKAVTARKPQYLIPEGQHLISFSNEYSAGLEFLRKLFTQTCKLGVNKFTKEFIRAYSSSHQ